MKSALRDAVGLPIGLLISLVFVGMFAYLRVFGVAALGVAWMAATLFARRRR